MSIEPPLTHGTVSVLTCNSEWVFDFERHRFLRLPRGLDGRESRHLPQDGWTSFDEVHFDTETPQFVVYLNADKSRMMRSYRHVEPCSRCETPVEVEATIELPRLSS